MVSLSSGLLLRFCGNLVVYWKKFYVVLSVSVVCWCGLFICILYRFLMVV